MLLYARKREHERDEAGRAAESVGVVGGHGVQNSTTTTAIAT